MTERLRLLDDEELKKIITSTHEDYTAEAQEVVLEILKERGYSDSDLNALLRVAMRRSGSNEIVPVPQDISSFNWGAAFLTALWLAFHGRINIAVALILMNVVFRYLLPPHLIFTLLSWLITICLWFYFGRKGNEIAWVYKRYRSVEELKAGQRGWNIAGKAVASILVLLLVIGFLV